MRGRVAARPYRKGDCETSLPARLPVAPYRMQLRVAAGEAGLYSPRMTKPCVLAVVGSSSAKSATRGVMLHAAARLRSAGCEVDLVDLSSEPLPMLNPEVSYTTPAYAGLKARVDRADVILIGTPDYHGCPSGVAKNFLDHFWKEFAGKLFASIVTSFEKGLTVTDQIRTGSCR